MQDGPTLGRTTRTWSGAVNVPRTTLEMILCYVGQLDAMPKTTLDVQDAPMLGMN